ncbi:hypothetical protein ACWER6_25285 [Streptomyces sp. NPDC004009]
MSGSGADASYSSRPDTLPAAMLDGDPATGWSNGGAVRISRLDV